MDLDLNQEPLESTRRAISGVHSLLEELESAHQRIEERIRQLEAVTSRARERQIWRQSQNTVETVNTSPEASTSNDQNTNRLTGEIGVAVVTTTSNNQNTGRLNGEIGVAAQERTFETGKFGKVSSAYLVAKALGIETHDKEAKGDTGGFYDCNICLVMAKDPILTHCGHLFCWPCFYHLSDADPNVKKCPVCLEEVPDSGIIPIYGSGNGDNTNKLKDASSKVPPRPQGRRIESMRQQLITNGTYSSPIEERIRRFRNMLIFMGSRTRSEDHDGASAAAETSSLASPSNTSQVMPDSEEDGSQRPRTVQVSRLLLQGAASFSSLSSALDSAMDSAERLVEDLETFVNGHRARRNYQERSSVANRDPLSGVAAAVHPNNQNLNVANTHPAVPLSVPPLWADEATLVIPTVIRADTQTLNNIADTDTALAHLASSSRTDDAASGSLRTDLVTENNSAMPMLSSSSQRRTEVSITTEMGNDVDINTTTPRASPSSRRRTGVSVADNRFCRETRRRLT